MSNDLLNDPAIFFAHALALEKESVERLNEIAYMMEVHNHLELQHLFHSLAEYSGKHAKNIEELCSGMNIPLLKPWEYGWPDDEGPETGNLHDLHYLMTEKDALEYALSYEIKAHHFYREVEEKSTNEKIKSHARQFAEEEAEHIDKIKQKMSTSSLKSDDWFHDLDPPHIPE